MVNYLWPKDLKTGLNEGKEKNFGLLKRKIPKTGEEIAALGLGTRHTFDVLWNAYEELSFVLDSFFQGGGNAIDTSPAFGEAERALGNLTYEVDYFLSTKLISDTNEDFFKSLSLLRKPSVSALFWQNYREPSLLAEALKLKEQGKIRYFGLCEMDEKNYEDLAEAMRVIKPDLILIPYNLLQRKAEKYILPLALELKIGVFVARPFAGGDLLSHSYPQKLPTPWEKLFCQTRAQALLKFILSHEAVSCVFTATRKTKHLRENLEAASLPLPEKSERESLGALLL